MDHQLLDEATYARRFRELIAGTESLHAHAQDVGDGKATIGWGYTFNRNNNEAIWRDSGIGLSDGQWQRLRDIDQAASSRKTALGLDFGRTLNEGEADRLLIASSPSYQTYADALALPDSRERLALVSVTYNRGVGAMKDHPVLDAIEAGDRAEAWYQLRYNCWGSNATAEAGLRKRRLAEAQVFGLYDDPDQVGRDEALSVLGMAEQRREAMDAVEKRFGQTIDGTDGKRDLVALANRDYPAITEAFGEVPTLREALDPARLALLSHLRAEHPAHAEALADDRVDVKDLHVRPGQAKGDWNVTIGDGPNALTLPMNRQTPAVNERAAAPLLPELEAPLQAAGHDGATRQQIGLAWQDHLQRHAHLGPADRVLLSRDGQTLAGLHGPLMSEMHIPTALSRFQWQPPEEQPRQLPQVVEGWVERGADRLAALSPVAGEIEAWSTGARQR